MTRPLVVGNWKMHGTQAEAAELAQEIRRGSRRIERVEVVLAPPFTALFAVARSIAGSSIQLAGQNVHWEMRGAFTGEISPVMLAELGCKFAIVGHSERRRLFNESDATVAKKITACLSAGLRPIICVGETWHERTNGMTTRVIGKQLRVALKGLGKSAIENFAIAYEPVWAIGTGRNATPDQVRHAHLRIRKILRDLFGGKGFQGCRILYGGSVRPDNAAELASTPEVNGLLVGGASLKAEDFLRIVRCFVRA